MPDTKKQLGVQRTNGLFDLTTIDQENRTVDVVFATEAPVLKYSWDGPINEVLICNTANVRMDRINTGAPLLDTHDKSSIKTQLGVVVNATITKNQARATVRFSKRPDVEAVWQDVIDNILRGVSVGYRVYEYDITEKINEAIPEYRAVDWEPMEVSLVPVPADYQSGLRASQEDMHEVIIHSKNKNSNPMLTEEAAKQRKLDIMQAVRAAKLDDAFGETLVNDENLTVDQARAAIINKLGETPAPPAAKPAPVNAKRESQILFAVRAAGFDADYAQTLIDSEGLTLDGARAAIIEKMASAQSQAQTRGANTAAVIPGGDVTDKVRKGMSAAILQRTQPSILKPDEIAAATEYRGMDLLDMARTCLENAGISTKGKLQREIATQALNIGERQMSTSDFPNILGNTINRTLRAAYDNAPRTFMTWSSKKNAKDFRDMVSVTLGDLTSLLKVVEGGEYKQSVLGEGAEKYRVAKYGTIINITWETVINDDLGAFERIPSKLAQAAANTQSDIMYNILSTNANMSDGFALFSTQHGNLAASGTAINVANLGNARAAMRVQKAPGGTYLNLIPKYLVVGPVNEQLALQYTSSVYTATKNSDINVWANLLTPIVDPRITDTSWYLMADPNSIDTVEYAFLDGEELFTEQRQGFEVDGMQTKVRMVFGAKAIDYRGLYKNPGA